MFLNCILTSVILTLGVWDVLVLYPGLRHPSLGKYAMFLYCILASVIQALGSMGCFCIVSLSSLRNVHELVNSYINPSGLMMLMYRNSSLQPAGLGMLRYCVLTSSSPSPSASRRRASSSSSACAARRPGRPGPASQACQAPEPENGWTRLAIRRSTPRH